MTMSDTDTEDLPEEGGWDLEDEEDGGDEEGVDGEEAADDAPSNDEGDGNRRRRGRREEPYEPSDARAKKALDFLSSVVGKMGMDCRVRLRRPTEGNAPDEI